eukprot:TRINITY_DN18316_c0_g2_i1.p1 TRINITY_DN18316_c0_g2~~TRINITY_DN18316_c0_g2_i1.p1  ORF type:complete len:887 (-),score=188.51 TRINITY_DN18316_c0_g2_i1:61-2721(-)
MDSTPEEDRRALQEVRRRLFSRWPEARNPLDSDPSTSPFSPATSYAGPAAKHPSPVTPSPAQGGRPHPTEPITPEKNPEPAAWTSAAAASAAAAAAASATSASGDHEALQELWRRLVERPIPQCPLGAEDDATATSLATDSLDFSSPDVFCPNCGNAYDDDSVKCCQCGRKRDMPRTRTHRAAVVAEVRLDPQATPSEPTTFATQAAEATGRSTASHYRLLSPERPPSSSPRAVAGSGAATGADSLLLRRQLFTDYPASPERGKGQPPPHSRGATPATSSSPGQKKEPPLASPQVQVRLPAGCSEALGGACELRVEDPSLVGDFEKLNGLLRRHGFREVPHQMEPLPVPDAAGPGAAALARIVADGRGLWEVCREVVLAYEDRGHRLQEALLTGRREDRQQRDSRVRSLLNENAKLQEELRAAKAGDVAQTRTPAASPSPASTGGSSVSQSRELSELQLRTRAAEATARHREKELEKLRSRLEQATADAAKRQERDRLAVARPLARKKGGSKDDPLLEAAVAHRARADNLQAEVSSLTKQVHVLSFRLEGAEDKLRMAEVQKSRTQSASGKVAQASSEADLRSEAAKASQELTRERELRAHAEAQLCQEQERHASEVRKLSLGLQKAEEQLEQHRVDVRSSNRQPSASELRWQREAMRLRDDLAEVRRAWKAVDTRGLMQRDKELRRLGLDARGLEETMPKSELVSCLLDVCRLLRLADVSQIVPKVSDLVFRHISLKPMTAEMLGQGAIEALQELDSSCCAASLEPSQALARLRALCASDAKSASKREDAEAPLLERLAAALRCEREELPQRAEALLRLCDERLAAQKIVDALQKLLAVDELTEVLPTLKEVLDVSALRRKVVRDACQATAAARADKENLAQHAK